MGMAMWAKHITVTTDVSEVPGMYVRLMWVVIQHFATLSDGAESVRARSASARLLVSACNTQVAV